MYFSISNDLREGDYNRQGILLIYNNLQYEKNYYDYGNGLVPDFVDFRPGKGSNPVGESGGNRCRRHVACNIISDRQEWHGIGSDKTLFQCI